MIKELKFRKKVQKLDVIHIRQLLERQGFGLVSIKSDLGRDLLEMLKLTFTGEKALVYKSDKLKYVFYDPALNEEDLLYVLLHECGHIELEHKTVSMQNEAAAWNFAYIVKNLHKKITGKILPVIISIIMTAAVFLFIPCSHNDVSSTKQIIQTSADGQSNDTVYITATGSKFHSKDCIYVSNKKTMPCTKENAETIFQPCSACIQ